MASTMRKKGKKILKNAKNMIFIQLGLVGTWSGHVLRIHGVSKTGKVLVTVSGVFADMIKSVGKMQFSPSFFSGNTPLHLAVMMGHKGEHCWNNVAANRLSLPACKSFPVTCEFVCLFVWMSFSSFIFPTFCVWIVCTYQHKIRHTSLHISQQTKTSCINKATLFFSSFLCSKTRLKTVNFP